jgi:hypothetical protein
LHKQKTPFKGKIQAPRLSMGSRLYGLTAHAVTAALAIEEKSTMKHLLELAILVVFQADYIPFFT